MSEVSMTDQRSGAPARQNDGLRHKLELRLSVIEGSAVRVDDLSRRSGGASRETWSFRATSASRAPRKLILRRDPPSEPRLDQMKREAIAIAAAGRHGVPGPGLVDWSSPSEVLDSPYLTVTFVEGETIARRILRDPEFGRRAKCWRQISDERSR